MRILTAEDGVQLDDLPLPGERIQVVRNGHQVGFRRQRITGMSPVGVGEDPELAGLDEFLHSRLGLREVARRGARIPRK